MMEDKDLKTIRVSYNMYLINEDMLEKNSMNKPIDQVLKAKNEIKLCEADLIEKYRMLGGDPNDLINMVMEPYNEMDYLDNHFNKKIDKKNDSKIILKKNKKEKVEVIDTEKVVDNKIRLKK